MGEAKRNRERAIVTQAFEAVRETFWTTLGDAAERMGCERGDLLALLLEKGMLLGGFDEGETDRFVARMEQIERGLDEHLQTALQAALEPQDSPVLPSLPGTGPPIDPRQIGRLALRSVGNEWVAFYAMPDTMEGAIELARIKLVAIEREQRRQGFMDLMREVIADILEERIGVRPIWPHPPQPAPRSDA